MFAVGRDPLVFAPDMFLHCLPDILNIEDEKPKKNKQPTCPLMGNLKTFLERKIPGGSLEHVHRVAQSAGIGGLDPSIAKDLIDSEDPKHTLFCREITFVAIYALFRDDISILW